MSTPSPIVPSKNALRVLRRLAFSPSALVASTIGSVCGIATLNHEVYRRVHLAEQALESKNIIRSLSHGRGVAQLNSMIDAAERGDDFTSGIRDARKRREKRHTPARSFSAVAISEPSEYTDDGYFGDVPPKLELHSINPFRKTFPGGIRKCGSDTPEDQSHRSHRPATAHTLGVHSMAVEKILQASKSQHKLPDHPTYGRPNLRGQPELDRARILLQQWVKRTDNDSEALPSKRVALPTEDPATLSTPRVLPPLDTTRDYFDRASKALEMRPPLKFAAQIKGVKIRLTRVSSRSTSKPPVQQHNLQTKDPRDLKPDYDNEIDVPVLWDRSRGTAPVVLQASTMAPAKPRYDSIYLFAHLDNGDSVDRYVQKMIDAIPESDDIALDALEMLAETTEIPEDFVQHAKGILSTGLFFRIQNWISAAPSCSRRQWKSWHAVMKRFSGKQGAPNWAMAEAMFYRFSSYFQHVGLKTRPVFGLIQHVLATASSSQRAGRVLFPRPGQKENSDAVVPVDLSVPYLQFFCEGEHSPADCVLELERVMDAAKRHGMMPSMHLAVPVLRILARAKDLEAAETLLERLTTKFGPSEVILLLEEHAFLNACEGNWGVVEAMLAHFHQLNSSRSEPIGSGRFFERLLLQHVSKNAVSDALDFTVHAMRNTGLIPTGHVTRALICACIRDGRHDLVVGWLRLVKAAFPRMTSGFDTSRGGWLLASSLSESGVSCEELAKVCKALAHGSRRDPFSSGFRNFVVEIVRSDLSQRLCAALARASLDLNAGADVHSMTLERLLVCVYEFRAAPTPTDANSTVIDGLKNDLAVQISAVLEIASIFRGDGKLLLSGVKLREDTLLKSRRTIVIDPIRKSRNHLKRTFHSLYEQERSPGIGKLTKSLIQRYHQRRKQDLPVDHTALNAFIITSGSEYPSEVLELVESISASWYAQGTKGAPFDHDFYKSWLYLVSTHGTQSSAEAALTAVVNSADQVQWTCHFRSLCEFVARLGHGDDDVLRDGRGFSNVPPGGSLGDLLTKIKSIWEERGRKETFKFPEWKGWEMDGR